MRTLAWHEIGELKSWNRGFPWINCKVLLSFIHWNGSRKAEQKVLPGLSHLSDLSRDTQYGLQVHNTKQRKGNEIVECKCTWYDHTDHPLQIHGLRSQPQADSLLKKNDELVGHSTIPLENQVTLSHSPGSGKNGRSCPYKMTIGQKATMGHKTICLCYKKTRQLLGSSQCVKKNASTRNRKRSSLTTKIP